ncbi:SDR family oxidoreductase [Actinospica sp.]|uniref:SDR family oxidoreductase n=1 Tax=Actinospica sp. TaxID=1872142 RepID=UPI002C65D6EA|nr:SDR family oxidoreductase [Actinospica sp.]HWG28522.1 SDR family oxidoreductase [Actinospica sp.]
MSTEPERSLVPRPEYAVRRRTVTSGGVDLAVFELGDPTAPPVLLVHGYPDTHRVWDAVAEDLAADHHVIRYDVRGAGASGHPNRLRGYRMDQLADDLFAVADAVRPDQAVHLAAHDWGSIQAWQAATDARATGRIASFTTMSGPCLDHVGHWFRRRFTHPTPRNVAQLIGQQLKSWYIGVFHVPLLAPAAWRLVLSDRWGEILRRTEDVQPRPGHPATTLRTDAVRGIGLYRANMLPRLIHPTERFARIPVQLITLTRDRFVSPALAGADLDRWVPDLRRREITAGHWSALSEKGPTVARMIRSFSAHVDGTDADLEDAGDTGTAEAAGATGAADTSKDSARESKPFTGRLAVVTGAGSGIGRATALAFAERGARVVVCDIDLEAAQRTAELAGLLGPAAHAYRVDVTDGAAVDAFAAEVAQAHGVPHIVVNNAGVGHHGTFLATTDKDWQRVLDVNLWGVIHGCRAFGTLMSEQGQGGSIVNLASAAAYLPSKVLAAYATSKAAVAMLSDCLRAELAPHGIGVSVICPGIVNTNITRTTTFSGTSPDEQEARRRHAASLYARRNYPPEKVADHIVDAVLRNRPMVPVTAEAKIARALGRLAPGLLRAAAKLNLG